MLLLLPIAQGLPTANIYRWRELNPPSGPVFNRYRSFQPDFYDARGATSNLLRTEKSKTIKLVTELAELGAKHVVTAVTQLPNIDPSKKAQFESIGLVGVTSGDTERMNSLLKELGNLGADASISLARNAGNVARDTGLDRKKALQIATFAKLVPLLEDLVDLGKDTSKASKSPLELLGSAGLDLESGLAFLKENNLDIADGLNLLSQLSNNGSGSSFNGLSDLNGLLGVGSIPGVSGDASSSKVLETPELKAQLDKTNDLLTKLAELGATYVVAAVADLPGLSLEKQRQYKSVGSVSRSRLNSLLSDLGKLGSKASTAVAKAGAQVPGLATLANLVPVLSGLAELASDDSESVKDATRNVFSGDRASQPFDQLLPGFPSAAASSRVLTPELRAQSEKTIALVSELSQLGAKYVVSAVADLPDLDPRKRALFQQIGLTGITSREKGRLDSLLLELGELGSDASVAVASAAANVAGTPGLTPRKAAQIAKFAKLVPILKGLSDIASETASTSSNSNNLGLGRQIVDVSGFDVEAGLEFLKKNGLDINNNNINIDKESLSSLSGVSQLVGVGATEGATGGPDAIRHVQTPELQSQLEKTKKLVTKLAELGAVYVVSAVADLPSISPEQRAMFKRVGKVDKAELNSLLVELGELGSDASIAVAKAGSNVPGLARLAKLVPVLTTLAELSLVADSEDSQENQAATRNLARFNPPPTSSQLPRSRYPAFPAPYHPPPFVGF